MVWMLTTLFSGVSIQNASSLEKNYSGCAVSHQLEKEKTHCISSLVSDGACSIHFNSTQSVSHHKLLLLEKCLCLT